MVDSGSLPASILLLQSECEHFLETIEWRSLHKLIFNVNAFIINFIKKRTISITKAFLFEFLIFGASLSTERFLQQEFQQLFIRIRQS